MVPTEGYVRALGRARLCSSHSALNAQCEYRSRCYCQCLLKAIVTSQAKSEEFKLQAQGPLSALRTLGAMLVPRTQDVNRDVADGIVVQVMLSSLPSCCQCCSC